MKTEIKAVSKIIKKYKGRKSVLIEILQDIEKKYNCLPPDALKYVSKELGVSLTDIHNITTFYRMPCVVTKGKHTITVCNCARCHINGAQTIIDRVRERLKIKPGCTSPGGKFSFEVVNGLNACSLGPVVVIDGQHYRECTVTKIDSILDGLQDKYQRKASRKRLDEERFVQEPKVLASQK